MEEPVTSRNLRQTVSLGVSGLIVVVVMATCVRVCGAWLGLGLRLGLGLGLGLPKQLWRRSVSTHPDPRLS